MSMLDVRGEGGERTICFSFQIYGRCLSMLSPSGSNRGKERRKAYCLKDFHRKRNACLQYRRLSSMNEITY